MIQGFQISANFYCIPLCASIEITKSFWNSAVQQECFKRFLRECFGKRPLHRIPQEIFIGSIFRCFSKRFSKDSSWNYSTGTWIPSEIPPGIQGCFRKFLQVLLQNFMQVFLHVFFFNISEGIPPGISSELRAGGFLFDLQNFSQKFTKKWFIWEFPKDFFKICSF